MTEVFADINFDNFWNEDPYYRDEYTDDPLTKEKIEFIQNKFGLILPKSYIALMSNRNGGRPVKDVFLHLGYELQIKGIFSIGNSASSSLDGEFSNDFWAQEWGYPAIGLYFADTPSAGHDLFAFDYRDCGPHGEPAVVNVDQEQDYRIQLLAPNFETFIRGLVPEPTDIP